MVGAYNHNADFFLVVSLSMRFGVHEKYTLMHCFVQYYWPLRKQHLEHGVAMAHVHCKDCNSFKQVVYTRNQ